MINKNSRNDIKKKKLIREKPWQMTYKRCVGYAREINEGKCFSFWLIMIKKKKIISVMIC